MTEFPWAIGPNVDVAKVVNSTVATGGTVTVPNTCDSLIFNVGSLAALTVNTPVTPQDGQDMRLSFKSIVTALTVTASGSQTIRNAPTAATADSSFAWEYDLPSTTWFHK